MRLKPGFGWKSWGLLGTEVFEQSTDSIGRGSTLEKTQSLKKEQHVRGAEAGGRGRGMAYLRDWKGRGSAGSAKPWAHRWDSKPGGRSHSVYDITLVSCASCSFAS